MAFSKVGPSRSARENLILAFSLASIAGAVNSIGFLELAVFTSNLSGSSTRLGEALVTHNHSLITQTLVLLLSFLGGAMTATLLVERARHQHRARYVVALVVQACVLTAATLGLEFIADRTTSVVYWLSGALAFSMGLQNALVTHISGAVVRTTHLTGIVTDLGIEIVHLGYFIRQRLQERGLLSVWSVLKSLDDAPDFHKARLHVTIFLSFLAGGAVGTSLHLNIGRPAMALPVVTLVALVVYDQWLQNQWRRLVATLTAKNDGDAEPDTPKKTGS